MSALTITVPAGWTILLDKKGMRALMRGVGAEIAATARASIRAGGQTKKRAARRQSVAGLPPVNRTGRLAASIKSRLWRSGDGVTVRDAAARAGEFYALFLEKGARGGGNPGRNSRQPINPKTGRPKRAKGVYMKRILAPHPFMEPALAKVVANGLADRVKTAMMDGMKFQRGAKS
jgi:hypothetical protein